MYITNSPSGTVVLFAATAKVGVVPVPLPSSIGNSAGGVSSIGANGSVIFGSNGSYGSFNSLSTIVHLPIFFLNIVLVSLSNGELSVNLTKKLSLLSVTVSTKVCISMVFSVSPGANPKISSRAR